MQSSIWQHSGKITDTPADIRVSAAAFSHSETGGVLITLQIALLGDGGRAD